VACLAAVASLSVLIIHNFGLDLTLYLIMIAAFLTGFLYAVPLKRFSTGGYAELVMTVFVASLVPALAFLLQGEDLHRLLGMSTFPLAAIFLAMLLALELPSYAKDLKRSANGTHTLMTRLGWQRGMLWHNYLLVGAFGIFGLALALDLPAQIGLPVFLALPVALYQVWNMHRIATGARPNWSLLSLLAIATFGLVAYLLTFTFWTR
jgi:1,4-dihydroxy-2-naphthoate octaprenyltransferase